METCFWFQDKVNNMFSVQCKHQDWIWKKDDASEIEPYLRLIQLRFNRIFVNLKLERKVD